jgi:hypothetical protein
MKRCLQGKGTRSLRHTVIGKFRTSVRGGMFAEAEIVIEGGTSAWPPNGMVRGSEDKSQTRSMYGILVFQVQVI